LAARTTGWNIEKFNFGGIVKKLLLVFAVLLFFGTADAQFYSYSMGGDNTADTLVASTADTTDAFNLWYSTSVRRPGDPCFEVYLTICGDATTTHDSLEAELWVTSRENLAKDGNGWMFVKTYNSWSMGDFAGDVILTNAEDFLIVADTLKYIPCKYARLIFDFIGGGAADSTTYIVYYTADRGASQ